MLEQFSRIQLLLGEASIEKLQQSRVAVFGVGVGGFAIEALARCGVGAIDIFDDDKVSVPEQFESADYRNAENDWPI